VVGKIGDVWRNLSFQFCLDEISRESREELLIDTVEKSLLLYTIVCSAKPLCLCIGLRANKLSVQ
jgi:hypothetical protein